MRKARVMVVDDSALSRRLMSDTLKLTKDVQVIGTASNGRIAIEKIPALKPDLITLDVEMPEMDGLETLAVLRNTHPKLPVIMFSATTKRGAEATLKALSLGAADYVAKPTSMASFEAAKEQLAKEIGIKVRTLTAVPRRTSSLNSPPATSMSSATARTGSTKIDSQWKSNAEIVVIGSSTGGPAALSQVLSDLPGDFPVPILVAQHMPPIFTTSLAKQLDGRCALQVSEARDGELLESGRVLIAPGGFHLEIERTKRRSFARLNKKPPENNCRPAVDVLFRSCAQQYQERSLAVILTGMGRDGLKGAERISDCGGNIIAQDEASSVVWGMPGAVCSAGLANRILSLCEIRLAICDAVI